MKKGNTTQKQKASIPQAPAQPIASQDFTKAKNPWLNPFFLALLGAFVLFGILLFDAKLFLMGDDADYILDAYNFIHKGTYPVGRSSLYAMVLAIPVAIVGTNVVPAIIEIAGTGFHSRFKERRLSLDFTCMFAGS